MWMPRSECGESFASYINGAHHASILAYSIVIVANMNFDLPEELKSHLQSIDSFIQSTILPLQHSNDNNRFFDHRREHARTDWDQNGNPRAEWEQLLGESFDSVLGAENLT